MDRNIDLDAIEREASGEPVKLSYKGETFELPPELPLSFIVKMMSGNIGAALDVLFGERASDFLDLNPTMAGLTQIVNRYGVGLGEALQSPDFSPNGGALLRQT